MALNGYRIGLALGSGSARGWSHIGVIRALAEIGVDADIVCGCSIGALVGAAYVNKRLDELEKWASSLKQWDIIRFFELNLSGGGFIDVKKLRKYIAQHVASEKILIESLSKKFATVATDLQTGREIWFEQGPVLDAVWASIALPGLFPPVQYHNQWLVDGGLVNPVPVSLCRALGADLVIAVNLNGDLIGRHIHTNKTKLATEGMIKNKIVKTISSAIKERASSLFSPGTNSSVPNIFNIIAGSINITQDRITRSRMAGDPPDFILNLKLSHIGLLEFNRAEETIAEGKACVKRMLPELHYVLGLH